MIYLILIVITITIAIPWVNAIDRNKDNKDQDWP